MFPNIEKQEAVLVHPLDPSGNSIIDDITFNFNSGDELRASCSDWEEVFRNKNNYTEGLSIAIQSKEIGNWLSDY